MTQKSGLFKGQQKKSTAANRHGKANHIRKGKTFKPPTKKGSDWEVNQEIGRFIDSANELKAATQASKEGARLRIVKAPEYEKPTASQNTKKKKAALIKKS